MTKNFSLTMKCLLIACFMITAVGCSHRLQVLNINAYKVQDSNPPERLNYGVNTTSAQKADIVIMESVLDNLRQYGNVVSPYSPDSSKDINVLVNIELSSEYKGSGTNFFITWPGYLIFFPAAHGFVYRINHNFLISLDNKTTGQKVPPFSVPVSMDIRYTSNGRGGWAEFGGWVLDPIIVPMILGLGNMKYDSGITPLEAEAVKSVIGGYIAREIINKVNTPPTPAALPTGQKTEIIEHKPGDNVMDIGSRDQVPFRQEAQS